MCGPCVQTQGCGYCLSSLRCLAGTADGPLPELGQACTEWAPSTDVCPGEHCSGAVAGLET